MSIKRTFIRDIISAEELSGDVFIQGLVRTRREGKGFTFIEVNDGSVIHSIQVIADENISGYDRIHDINTGRSFTDTWSAGIFISGSPGSDARSAVMNICWHSHANADISAHPVIRSAWLNTASGFSVKC